MERLKERIAQIAILRDNWDDLGTRKPDPIAVRMASKFVDYLAFWRTVSPPKILVDPNGACRFVWDHESYTAELTLGSELTADIEWRYGVHASEADELANLIESFPFWFRHNR